MVDCLEDEVVMVLEEDVEVRDVLEVDEVDWGGTEVDEDDDRDDRLSTEELVEAGEFEVDEL